MGSFQGVRKKPQAVWLRGFEVRGFDYRTKVQETRMVSPAENL
jgi:hypothetical protein